MTKYLIAYVAVLVAFVGIDMVWLMGVARSTYVAEMGSLLRKQPNLLAAVMFYLAAYALMNIGAFAVVSHFARRGEKYVSIDDLAGLGERQPMTAALLTVYMLSLIGIPLTAGFFGKFYIFRAALDHGFVWLTVAGLMTSAVAAWYYLKVLVVVWMNEPGEAVESAEPLGPGLRSTLLITAAATILLGVFPSFVLNPAVESAGRLLGKP